MKQFHALLSNCTNRTQLEQLLHESHQELKNRQLTVYDCGEFFNRVYGLDFDGESMIALGKFIKYGRYKVQLELYK